MRNALCHLISEMDLVQLEFLAGAQSFTNMDQYFIDGDGANEKPESSEHSRANLLQFAALAALIGNDQWLKTILELKGYHYPRYHCAGGTTYYYSYSDNHLLRSFAILGGQSATLKFLANRDGITFGNHVKRILGSLLFYVPALTGIMGIPLIAPMISTVGATALPLYIVFGSFLAVALLFVAVSLAIELYFLSFDRVNTMESLRNVALRSGDLALQGQLNECIEKAIRFEETGHDTPRVADCRGASFWGAGPGVKPSEVASESIALIPAVGPR